METCLFFRRYSTNQSGASATGASMVTRSEEHTSELQSPDHLVCRLLLEKKKNKATAVPGTLTQGSITRTDLVIVINRNHAPADTWCTSTIHRTTASGAQC